MSMRLLQAHVFLTLRFRLEAGDGLVGNDYHRVHRYAVSYHRSFELYEFRE